MTNSLATNPTAVAQQVLTYLADPRFAYKLEELLTAHTRVLEEDARTAVFRSRLVAAGMSDPSMVLLAQLSSRKSMHYGPQEWIPSPFETLERHGFCTCHHGSRDHTGCDSRTLYITAAGEQLVQEIQQAADPRLAA
jgi:hypothetical protein